MHGQPHIKIFFQYVSFQAMKKIWIPLGLNFNFVIQLETYNSMHATLTQEHIYRYFFTSNKHFSYFTTEYIIFCNNIYLLTYLLHGAESFLRS